jgi:hypothetical protein
MADEYTDVNKYAHEGGDTAPGTREQIAARNKAADELAAAAREVAEARAAALDEASTKLREAEAAYHEAVPSSHVVPPSEAPAATTSSRRSKSDE